MIIPKFRLLRLNSYRDHIQNHHPLEGQIRLSICLETFFWIQCEFTFQIIVLQKFKWWTFNCIEKTNIKLSTAFAECEVLGEMARGEMVTDVLSEVDDYWKNRNIVVDQCMRSKGFELK